MPDTRTIDNYIDDTLSILLLKPRLSPHSLTSLIHKISEDIASREKSKNNRLTKTGPHWTTNVCSGYCLDKTFPRHLEHPVPRGKIIHWLCNLPAPSRHDVERAINLFLLTCWVTRSVDKNDWSEERELDNGFYPNKTRTKASMPPGWCILHGDPWARYRYVQGQPKSKLSNVLSICSCNGGNGVDIERAQELTVQMGESSVCNCQPPSPNLVP